MLQNIINFPRRLIATLCYLIGRTFSFLGGAFGYLAYLTGDKVEDITITEEELLEIIKEVEKQTGEKVEVEYTGDNRDMHDWLNDLEDNTQDELDSLYGDKSGIVKNEDDNGTIH